jgi:hypothetical protein
MVSHASAHRIAPISPHCRALRRGSLGDSIDGRSREGKFLRKCDAELVAQIGGEPSFAQSLLIRRAARALLQLEILDKKMATGNWTGHDGRTQSGLNNAVRLCLRELGVKAVPAPKPSPLADHFSRPIPRSATP